MPKSELEIIQEFEDTYVADPSKRGMSSYGACEYLTSEGEMCAVGRCMINPGEYEGTVTTAFYDEDELDEALKPEYRGHSLAFWQDLQYLHDASDYWDSNGFTEIGRKRLAQLKEEYAKN